MSGTQTETQPTLMPVQLPRLDGHPSFFADIIIVAVEGGLYEWFDHRNYRWSEDPQTKAMDASVEIREVDEDEGTINPWVELKPESLRAAFERLAAGPVECLHEDTRAALLGTYFTCDAGNIDINDADALLQVLLLGKVVYG
jgi:hypothetical protein